MAGTIRLDDRYSVIYGAQILLFDNQMKKAIPLHSSIAHHLVNLAKMGNELSGLGATMTLTFTLPGEKTEIQMRFEPAADDLELDDDRAI